MKKAVIIADAGKGIGTGHVKRCLSLASGLEKEDFECLFVILPEEGKIIRKEIKKRGFNTCDYEEIEKINPDVIITDSYRLDSKNISNFKTMCSVLVSIDDLARLHYSSDIVINQNVYAEAFKKRYKTEEYTKLLLGPKYAILNEQFKREEKQIPNVAKTMLITMGGTDIHNQSLRVLTAAKEFDLEITVVLGMFYEFGRRIKRNAEEMKNKIMILENIDNMHEVMQDVDIAVSAAGTTIYELMFMGIPSALMILADNQKYNAYAMKDKRLAVWLGWHNNMSKEIIRNSLSNLIKNKTLRENISRNCRELVDAQGTKRIIKEITDLLQERENCPDSAIFLNKYRDR